MAIRLSSDVTADEPVGIYVSIFADHLAMSIFPPLAETELLPAFLGLEMPADSNAATRLAELNAEHSYTSYGSGILDLDRFVAKIQMNGFGFRVKNADCCDSCREKFGHLADNF